VQTSKTFAHTAKQHELVNKLLSHVTPLFELDAEPLEALEKTTGDLNLNQMIMMHG
jgi:hypothetical protein